MHGNAFLRLAFARRYAGHRPNTPSCTDGRPLRSAAQSGTQWLVTCRSYSPSGKLLKAWGPALTPSDATCPTAAAPVAVTDITYDDLDRASPTTQSLTPAEGGSRITDTVYNLDDSVNNVKRAVGSAVAQTYVHGPGVDEPLVVYEGATTAASAKSWLYADHLGSIIGTANATGTSTAVYSYGPYGEPNTLTGQRFRYTGSS